MTIAFIGLVFSMVAIRLMRYAENAQVVIAGAIGQRQLQNRVVAMTIGTRKFLMVKVGIAFFSKTSSLIFVLQEMYPERLVQGAALTVLKTTLVSNKVKIAAKKHGRHARHAAHRIKKIAATVRN
jgi:hypothetical protein